MTEPDAAAHEVKDFTIRRDPHRFRIEPDTFAAPPLIGGLALRKLAGLHGSLPDLLGAGAMTDDGLGAAIDAVAEMMKILIPGRGGQLFADRLRSDGNPGDPEADPPVPASPPVIDLQREALPVIYWLLERYGVGRPTQPSSDSPAGSTESTTGDPSAGTSSTDGVLPEV